MTETSTGTSTGTFVPVTDATVETAARAYHEAVPEAVAGSWGVATIEEAPF